MSILLLTTTGALVVSLVGGSSWEQHPASSSSSAGYRAPLHASTTGDKDEYYSYPQTGEDAADDAYAYQLKQQDRSPPPPPPPGRPMSGSTAASSKEPSNYRPIHYEFKARTDNPDQEGLVGDGDDAYITKPPPRDSSSRGRSDGETASARRDIITRYISGSFSRALYLRLNAAIVGAALGAFVAKSFVSNSASTSFTISVTCVVAFFILSYFRNPYGELVRALGMTLVLILSEQGKIRRRYPSLVHVKSSLGISARSNFPPTNRSPWTYKPREDDDGNSNDPDFSMLYTLVAMASVGSLVGGNLPLIPSWMGALALGSVFAFCTTLPSARGDLARCMGMRVVAVGQEAWQLQSELQLLSKFAVVSGKIADKLLILDRKHRIKDRVISGVSFLYDQILKATQQRNQEEDDTSLPRRRRPPPDDRGGRSRGEEDWEAPRSDRSSYYEPRRGRDESPSGVRGSSSSSSSSSRYDDPRAAGRRGPPRRDEYYRPQSQEQPPYEDDGNNSDSLDRTRRR